MLRNDRRQLQGGFLLRENLSMNRVSEPENGDSRRTPAEVTRPHYKELSGQTNSVTARMSDNSFQ